VDVETPAEIHDNADINHTSPENAKPQEILENVEQECLQQDLVQSSECPPNYADPDPLSNMPDIPAARQTIKMEPGIHSSDTENHCNVQWGTYHPVTSVNGNGPGLEAPELTTMQQYSMGMYSRSAFDPPGQNSHVTPTASDQVPTGYAIPDHRDPNTGLGTDPMLPRPSEIDELNPFDTSSLAATASASTYQTVYKMAPQYPQAIKQDHNQYYPLEPVKATSPHIGYQKSCSPYEAVVKSSNNEPFNLSCPRQKQETNGTDIVQQKKVIVPAGKL